MVLVVAQNETRDSRTITVTVNGQPTRVVQNGVGCSYAVSASVLDLNADTTSGSVTLTATPGCTWTATSSEGWIRLLPSSGSGSSVIALDITANSGDVRHASLTVAGQRVSVTQGGRG